METSLSFELLWVFVHALPVSRSPPPPTAPTCFFFIWGHQSESSGFISPTISKPSLQLSLPYCKPSLSLLPPSFCLKLPLTLVLDLSALSSSLFGTLHWMVDPMCFIEFCVFHFIEFHSSLPVEARKNTRMNEWKND